MNEYAYVVNVDGIVVRGDDYLLIERSEDEEHAPGTVAFPGGKIEQSPGGNNTIETTASREISEEVGIEVGSIEYICSNTFESDTGVRCLNIIVLCEYVSGNAYPRATAEVATTHWLTYDEIKAREDVPASIERFVDQAETVRMSI